MSILGSPPSDQRPSLCAAGIELGLDGLNGLGNEACELDAPAPSRPFGNGRARKLSCRPARGPLRKCRRSLSRPCGKRIGNERAKPGSVEGGLGRKSRLACDE
jgi:hypothetical protein